MVAFLRFRVRRSSGLLFTAALLLAASFSACDAPPAFAQGYGWFGGLFGGGRPQDAPQYPDGYGRPNAYYGPRRRAQRHKQNPAGQAPVEQAQEPAAAKPKEPPKAATVFVDVFGDSLGQLLANGLDEALADKPEVGIIHLAHGSSGLVNDGYYDWPKTIDAMLAHQGKPSPDKTQNAEPPGQSSPAPSRIDVAVMMIGSNDRQPITQDGKKLQPGSEEWNAAYRKRVLAIAEALQKKRIPLVWVGVPIVKNDDFADDMAALNDIYRDVAARTGASYVDTWEAFSDDNGDFSAFGPDINGQVVRLRSADGIYFTKAGARKLAHFVEAQVRRDLDGKTPLPELPTADTPSPAGKEAKPGKPAVALVKPEAGPIKNLGEPPAAKDGRLIDVPEFRAEATRDAVVANSLIKGQPDPAPVGRADNFRWPSGGPAR